MKHLVLALKIVEIYFLIYVRIKIRNGTMVARKFCPHSFRARSSSLAKKFTNFFSFGLHYPQLLVLARGGPKFIQPALTSSQLFFPKDFFSKKKYNFKRIFLKQF
jgi:hypothetical protein